MSDALLRHFAAAIRAMRRRRGLTQAALAGQAGLPRLKIIQIEKGDPGVSIGAYAAAAAALGAELSLAPQQRPTLEEARELFADDD
ncbi:MAG TPA: helix-turn-helix domain-containing protein [Rhodanobacteraceae bacterium]|nr:helix-turn-helix domain-containing protein [Rhodanobacteraceae bacterium]